MPREPEPLYTDADGVPTLFDVVVPGDVLRRHDYRLPGAERESAGDQSEEAIVALLQSRLRSALRAVLSDAVEEAIRRRHEPDHPTRT